jgi:hypothetical protein
VGDSRAYLFRRGQIWQVTKDHSIVQQMVDLGALAPDQAALHPDANKITRALGMKAETEVDLREAPLPYEPDDILILATDGLCDLVRGEEIASILSHAATLDGATEELIRCANSRGGHDNITVQLARIRRSVPVAASPEAGPVPTLVDRGVFLAPEKTVVDPLPAPPAERPAPTLPAGAPVGPVAVPIVAASPPVGPGPAIPQPPLRTSPGAVPSRGGCFALAVGLALVVVILGGIVAWWIFRGPR